MEYIRGQDGRVHSVSGLEPPCRMEGSLGAWCLPVTTAAGKVEVYAMYYNASVAAKAYDVVLFLMDHDEHGLLKFKVGIGGLPYGWEEWKKSGVKMLAGEWYDFLKEEEASGRIEGADYDGCDATEKKLVGMARAISRRRKEDD